MNMAMEGEMRYFLEISQENNSYTVSLHQGNPKMANKRINVALGSIAKVIVKGEEHDLGELVRLLKEFDEQRVNDIYDERGQLDIGHYLYQQLIGGRLPTDFNRPGDDQVDLRLITSDEHIASLPWPLMAHKGVFLSTCNWSVTLARTDYVQNCQLPDHPRVLIVTPEPDGKSPTGWKAHVEQLTYRLSI